MVWEERWNPLRQEWMIVAAHRNNRPWQGGQAPVQSDAPAYLPDCYLCPRNTRVSGHTNADYPDVFVFDNDHPCVGPLAPTELAPPPADFMPNRRADGIARVVCYSPNHSETLAELSAAQIEVLMRTWAEQYRELGARPEVNHVLTFENKGEVIGVSNPHPHCQIYATNFVFKVTEVEVAASRAHHESTGRYLMEDILAAELQDGRRILAQNDGAVAFIPYFGRWAYELFVAPRARRASIAEFSDADFADTAEMLRQALVKLDNLWQMPMPYLLTLHQAPTDGGDYGDYHFYFQVMPPLRGPNLLKYLAGPEIGGGNFLSDTCPEDKAAELRDLPVVHYKHI